MTGTGETYGEATQSRGMASAARSEKEFELEAEFLEAFSTHFRDGLGRRYQQIAERAPKARKLAEQSR